MALACIESINKRRDDNIMYESYTYHDRGSWKKTLHNKAMFFEKHTQERHNILGSYPSSVRLIPPKHYAGSQEGAWQKITETGELPTGWIFDHGTTGLSNVAHTSSWTGCLLTSQAFRVAFLRSHYGENSTEYRDAYARANEIINSFRILTLVSGQPGYLARGIALGHGVSYEERERAGTRDLWAQGAGEFSHLRYRGGPSHHNYDQVFRGLGIYYFVAADIAQKDKIREIIADMSNWAHLKNNMVVMHVDGKRVSTVLIGGWRGLEGDDKPSGGSVMAIAGLKISSLVTGNIQVKKLHDEWVEKLGLLDPARNQKSIMGHSRGNYDDTDHLLADLYLLNIIEENDELRAFYRKCVKDSWEVHREDKMSWFNFIYRAVLGDEYGDLEGSLWNLQTHPTCRVFQPRMNSIRTDIEFHEANGRRESLHPLPVYERPSDNEYEWKVNPYSLDGWTSRIVSVLEVSPHDPYIQFAADTSGVSYWSNTQGEIWHGMVGLPRVHDFLFSPDYPWIAFAATDGGVYRTLDGGVHWNPVFNQPILQLQFCPNNTHILYAVGRNGVYKSEDMGEYDMGLIWRSVSGNAPTESIFALELRGDSPVIYLLTRQGLYSKAEDDLEWKAFPKFTRHSGFSTVDQIMGRPLWLRIDPHIQGRLFRAVETERRETIVSVSDDFGQTWGPVLRELKLLTDWSLGLADSTLNEKELRSLRERFREFRISDLRVDPTNPDVWYGLMETGVAITRDAGNTWSISRDGLDIPRVYAIWIPRHTNLVMVGTPTGMYASNDQGKSWTDTPLIPQEEGAIRSEIGGIGYLTAYWMGRHHGFITTEDANKEWWE
jgi:hypothetical protein